MWPPGTPRRATDSIPRVRAMSRSAGAEERGRRLELAQEGEVPVQLHVRPGRVRPAGPSGIARAVAAVTAEVQRPGEAAHAVDAPRVDMLAAGAGLGDQVGRGEGVPPGV